MTQIPSKDEILAWISDNPTLSSKRDIAKAFGIKGADRIELKRILRELLARYVPRELWDGPKRGFTFPLHDFLAGDGHALVHRHVLNGRWLARGLLRPDVVRRHARQYMAGDRHSMFRVWALVVLGAWLDAHEDLT